MQFGFGTGILQQVAPARRGDKAALIHFDNEAKDVYLGFTCQVPACKNNRLKNTAVHNNLASEFVHSGLNTQDGCVPNGTSRGLVPSPYNEVSPTTFTKSCSVESTHDCTPQSTEARSISQCLTAPYVLFPIQ